MVAEPSAMETRESVENDRTDLPSTATALLVVVVGVAIILALLFLFLVVP